MSERSIVKMVEALRNPQAGAAGATSMIGVITRISPLTIKTSDVEITHNLYLNTLMQPSLAAGDTIVLIRMGDSFYVVAKVVKVS